MKCIICFEEDLGLGTDDYFVKTKNGHLFHQSCVLSMIAGGTPKCPICDEDLQNPPPLPLGRGCAPPVPPRPVNYSNSLQSETGSMNRNDSMRLIVPSSSHFQPVSYCVQPDVTFKVVILGDLNVGKSSLLQRYADEKFDPLIMSTAGCDLRVKVLQIAGKVVRLNLWDTAGQERHRALVNMYLRQASGIIFCFDITDLESFLSLQSWYQFAQRNLPGEITKVIVGNKSDLWSQRVVHSAQIRNLAKNWNAQYIYASAKDATNVEAVFRSLAALILEKEL